MLRLHGVFAPVITPFVEETGDLDHEGLVRNASRLAAAGLPGVVLFGTTGEGPLVEPDEQAAAIERVRATIPDRALLVAGWAESTRAAVGAARRAAQAGADAFLLAAPSYYLPQLSSVSVKEHFAAVADASRLPLIIYQTPSGYGGLELKNGLIAELAHHPNIIGVKDSRGDLKALAELVGMCPRGFGVLTGSATMLYGSLEAGATGAIVAEANLVPDWCQDIQAFHALEDHERAGELQEKVVTLSRGIVKAFGIPGVKAAMDLLGQRAGPPRAPLRKVRERDLAAIGEALDAVGLRTSR